MAHPPISRQLFVALGTPVALLVFVALLLLYFVSRMTDASRWVEHSTQVTEKATLAEREVIDQDRSVHVFLLSRDRAHLRPFDLANPRAQLAELRTLVADNPIQTQRARDLSAHYADWLELAQTALAKVPAGTDPDVAAAVLTPMKVQMDRVRSEFSVFLEAETELRAQRQEAARGVNTMVFTTMVPLFLALGLILAFVSNRQIGAVRDAFGQVLHSQGYALTTLEGQAWARARHAKRISETVGSAIRASEQKNQLRQLLDETQRQAKELKHQQEKLAATNQELELRSQAMNALHAQLNERNAALQASNANLQRQKLDLERLSTELQRKADELSRTSNFKSQFVANMSHELRTPLNSSMILAKLLAENQKGNLDPEQVRYAETIYGAGRDLLALINDILDLSKVEAGKLEIALAPISISALGQGLVRMFEPLAKEKGLDLRLTGDSEGTFESDAQRVEQILRNLLSNAMKFTDRGAITLDIQLGAVDVVFVVKDTGIGIAPEHREIIFEAFAQADAGSSRRRGGTGLGLSIARELTHLLGGQSAVESEPGAGSTFTLNLPRAPGLLVRARSRVPAVRTASVHAEHGFVSPAQTKAPSSSPKEPSLLVVDDDKTFATVVCDIAGERGFRCVAAPTADAALALVNESPPDIVLLDLRLPDHPGLFVLDQLKRNPKTKHIPVHVLSAFDEVKSARTLGAFDYTVKPLDRTALIALLERLRARLGGAKRVLAVSANSALLDELSHLLATEHVEIVTAETVADACKHFEKTSFDCIVAALEAGHDELLRALGAPFNRTLPPVVLYATTPLGDDEEERLMRYSRYVTMARATSPEGLVEEVSLAMKGPPSAREASKADGRPRPLAQTRDAILAGQTVLLAEDDVRNVFSITSLLSARGGRVVTARTGVQALSLLDQHEDIALVLMDIMMPEMDGLTAIREIRQRGGRYTTLPIIAITAKAMREDQQRCIEAGASDCLAKPLDVERLVSLVRVWLS